MLIKVDYKVETGEAERIAVDWSSKGGEGGGSCEYTFHTPFFFIHF